MGSDVLGGRECGGLAVMHCCGWMAQGSNCSLKLISTQQQLSSFSHFLCFHSLYVALIMSSTCSALTSSWLALCILHVSLFTFSRR